MTCGLQAPSASCLVEGGHSVVGTQSICSPGTNDGATTHSTNFACGGVGHKRALEWTISTSKCARHRLSYCCVPGFPLNDRAQTVVHSVKQYFRSLKPSLKMTSSFLSVIGPNPGAPSPPRMHAGMHFRVHPWISLPLAPFINFPSPGSCLPAYCSWFIPVMVARSKLLATDSIPSDVSWLGMLFAVSSSICLYPGPARLGYACSTAANTFTQV